MDTKRLPNESVSEYKIRLCSNKEAYGLSWSQIAELLNKETGSNLSPDTYRKEWASYSLGYADGLRAGLNDDNVIKEYELKKIELQKEKYKLQDQKREFMNILRSTARFEHIKDELQKAIYEIAKSKPIEWRQPVSVSSNRHGVMIFGDWHYGMKVDNGFNKFNENEFIYRVRKLIANSIRYGKENNISRLYVVINGDMIHGGIHVSTRVHSTESIINQLMRVSEILSECIAEYANNFSEVFVYNTLDNHSRLFPNKAEMINDENLAKIIPWYIKARLSDVRNVNVMENMNDEIARFKVFDYVVYAVHGHRDKPEEVVHNLTLLYKEVPDYVIINHYHHSHELEVNGVYVIMSASLCGPDEYAINVRMTHNPSQKLLIFEKGAGRICTYNISV